MKMQQWLNARSAQLLTDINNTPFTDDCEEVKMQMIMTAMRESSVEMFHRAAENSRKEIEKINAKATMEDIQAAENKIEDNKAIEEGHKVLTAEEMKPEPKIKLTSSVVRRVDSF